jgi:XTP/dITP diphosphohydrolase
MHPIFVSMTKVQKNHQEAAEAFIRLLQIMDELRTHCPWDQKQTMESLRTLSIEELYELSDAILESNPDEIRKELGDLFLHLVFYARIAHEKNWFRLSEVLHGICDKLIERHPHIYGDVEAKDAETVKQNWEKIKLKEGHRSVLAGVPNSLPALVKAWRMQEKASGVGFDWKHEAPVWDKIDEEIREFKLAVQEASEAEKEEEFGDLLFSLVNLARFQQINPEDALARANQKFKQRFQGLEAWMQAENKTWDELSEAQADLYWERVKAGQWPKTKKP